MRIVIIIVFLMSAMTSCATKHKTKKIERTEFKNENVIQNDSVFQLKSKVAKKETNTTFNEFENILKALNVQYDGEQSNDLKVVLNKTEQGVELKVSGKGKANYIQHSKQTYNLAKSNVLNTYDSLKKTESSQDKVEQSKLLVNRLKNNTKKQKFDFSIWIYLVVGSILAIWVAIKQLKK